MPQINFQYPEALWLLAGVPLLLLVYLVHQWRRRKQLKTLGDARLVQKLLATSAQGRHHLKFALALIAFALGCLAIAHPRHPQKGTMDVRKGIDIMLALDVSSSMLAADGGTSRLSAARNLLMQLAKKLPNDRIGLVLFAGSAYVQMPLTFDRGAADLFISGATPASVKSPGTAIGDALAQAMASFDPESERYQTVVLVTDGETHDETALQQSKGMAERGISIHSIGIGSPEGATLTDTILGTSRRDAMGNVIVSRLNEPLLQQLAANTGGQYWHLNNNTGEIVAALAERFGQMEQKGLGDASQFSYLSLYLWFVIPMAALLLLEIFIPLRKKVRL